MLIYHAAAFWSVALWTYFLHQLMYQRRCRSTCSVVPCCGTVSRKACGIAKPWRGSVPFFFFVELSTMLEWLKVAVMRNWPQLKVCRSCWILLRVSASCHRSGVKSSSYLRRWKRNKSVSVCVPSQCCYVHHTDVLTLYGHIKTAEQRTIIQKYGDWYTGRWWVGCYIWYREEGPELTGAPPIPLVALPNVIAHPSTASSYYLMWHYTCLWTLKG